MLKRIILLLLVLMPIWCMAAAFTVVNPGDDIQVLAIHNELNLSYHERKWAIDYTAANDYVPFVAGQDIQTNYYAIWQNWMEANCDKYMGPNLFTNFTLATFRIAMGQTNGFRRATSWTLVGGWNFTNGIMQTGDVIGWWIFQDLQNGFKALTNTWQYNLSQGTNWYRRYVNFSTNTYNYADFVSSQDALWTASTWEGPYSFPAADPQYEVTSTFHKDTYSGTNWSSYVYRSKGQPLSDPLNILIPHIAHIYFSYAHADYFHRDIDGYRFKDIDSLGVIEGPFYLIETLPQSSLQVEMGSMYYASDANPFTLCGYTDPGSGVTSTNIYDRIISEVWENPGLVEHPVNRWVINWQFTYK